jgi:hypothetical protein
MMSIRLDVKMSLKREARKGGHLALRFFDGHGAQAGRGFITEASR